MKLKTNSLNFKLKNSFSIYRNDMFILFGILNKNDFQKLKGSFTSDRHEITKKSLAKEWSCSDFKEMTNGNELFQIIAR
jgi:hypothetical protein